MFGLREPHALGDHVIGPRLVRGINEALFKQMLVGIEPCGLVDALWIHQLDMEFAVGVQAA